MPSPVHSVTFRISLLSEVVLIAHTLLSFRGTFIHLFPKWDSQTYQRTNNKKEIFKVWQNYVIPDTAPIK